MKRTLAILLGLAFAASTIALAGCTTSSADDDDSAADDDDDSGM